MTLQRTLRAAMIAATLAASAAWAQAPGGDSARLSSQYAGWAGSKANADSLVGGLHAGSSVTLVTTGAGNGVSLAGFTPASPMSYGEIRSALGAARQSLARLGISNPTAEEIQAALIGGDVTLRDGRTRQVAGVLAPRVASPVAVR